MFKEKIKEYVRENPKTVTMRQSLNFPELYVLKYKKTVFYNNSWNEYLEHCRGSIVDKDFNLVSYPFQKIYNYGIEKQAPVLEDNTQVTAYRKVNGFMVACSHHNNDVLVSTTGSTDSQFVDMAKEMMLKHMPWNEWQTAFSTDEMQNVTVMFEAVHRLDPHIIPETAGMYVLGYREKEWNSPVNPSHTALLDFGRMLNCFVPECVVTTVAELKQMVKECRHEGYVAYTNCGQAFKIKSPYYLTSKWVARPLKTDKLVDLKNDVKRTIDEEYHNLIDAIRSNIDEYTAMTEQQRLAWVRTHFSEF